MRKLALSLLMLGIVCAMANAQLMPKAQIEGLLQRARTISYDKLDSAVFYANEALLASQKVDSQRLVFKSYRTLGLIYEDNNALSQAKQNYALALNVAEKFLPLDDKLTIYTDWAIINKKLGEYQTARDYHLRTVEEAEKAGIWEMVEDGYHGLGTMYSMLSNFNQSIHYYLLSIRAAEKWGNKKGIVLTQQNISNIYMKAKNYDMALKNIAKTYEMAQEVGDSVRIGAVLRVYGVIETEMGRYNEALLKLLQASSIAEQRGDKPRISESYLAIGDVYYRLKNYAESERYFEKCAELVTFLPKYSRVEFYHKLGKLYQAENLTDKAVETYELGLSLTDTFEFKEIARETHLILASIFAQKKNFEQAFVHTATADRLGQALFEEANRKNMTDAQLKFDIEKRDLQIEAQEKKLSQSRIIRSVLAVGLLLLSGLLLFTWKQMREKQKATRRNELIIKELHHRVKNNMQTIASMMRLQARQSQDPSVTAILLENKSRLETFSMLHQRMYQTDEVQTLNLQPFIEDMIDKLRFSHGLDETQLVADIRTENTDLNVEVALSIGLIINELLTNSLKYAYPSLTDGTPLNIRIAVLHNAFYYADNGKSLPADFDFQKKAGFGIQFITSFVHQIKGKSKFYVSDGMHFDLEFPA